MSTGEVQIPEIEIEGYEARRTVVARVEWTFQLEFVEIVWGDGDKIGRRVQPTTDLEAFGSKQFRLGFDASGKEWVRFAAWESAGNGVFTQPVHF